MAEYDLGDIVALQAVFSVAASGCTLTVLLPDDTTVTPAAGTSDNLTWTANYTPTLAGPYWYRFVGAGAVAAQEGTFTVRPLRTVAAGPTALNVLSRDEGLAAVALASSNTAINMDAFDRMIGGVSRLLDRKCGPIVKRTITGERHSGGELLINTKFWPIDSVTSCVETYYVTSYTLTEEIVGTVLPLQFIVYPRLGEIHRRESGYDYPFRPGRKNIVTTYVAGRFSDTASVDVQFKEAASIVLAEAWRSQFGMRGPDAPPPRSYELSEAARELLQGELLMDIPWSF